MATTAVSSVTTAGAGSVGIAVPAGEGRPQGGIVVNSTLAGSVKSTGTTGASNVPNIGWGAADANSSAAGGCVVTTICAGAVDIGRPVRRVNTRNAGSVKIDFAAAQLGGDSNRGPGDGMAGAVVAGTRGASTTVAGAGSNGQEDDKVSWKVAAAAAAAASLDLFDLAHGDKLRAFLVVIAGAVEMHARGSIGRRILYASIALLLVGITFHHSAWILNRLSPDLPGLHAS